MKFFKLKRIKLGDIKKPINVQWNKEQIDLIPEIENNYNPKIGIINISSDRHIIDGKHRYLILLKKYGENYEIITKIGIFHSFFYYFTIIILLPILIPLGFIIGAYKFLKKNEFKKYIRKN